MTPAERRASGALAAIFALRMLGLFLVLPVFALEAARYPGGDDPARVGLAMGVYGLTQALLQLPLGLASDRLGRKRVIVAGLLVFAAGSLLAALATSLDGLLWGRALQGAGAVSAAVTALLADQTRDAVRTKAMALVGMSIGLMFALSLLLAPWLSARVGLSGIFGLTLVLALGGVAATLWLVPPEQPRHAATGVKVASLRAALANPQLLRLNLGVGVLHAVQMAMWVVVPVLLAGAGLAKALHWQVYLPAVVLSFVLMSAVLFPLERRGYLRAVFLGAIGLLGLVQLGLGLAAAGVWAGLPALALWMVLFFAGFNVLEASQPSMVSRMAPAALRGAALGAYNTAQSLGLFVGGAMGGLLVKTAGAGVLFAVTAALCGLWLALAWGLAPQPGRAHKG